MRTSIFILFSFVLFLPQILSAQTFEDRRAQYIDSAFTNFDNDVITLQAYEGVTVDQPTLDGIYAQMQTRSTIDFVIVQLVRVMMLSNGAYDSQIIPALNSVPYWINDSDTTRGYWSENHMIMWMSSDWIMHEYTGRPADPTLEQRIKHYLNLKINYGFYEYFSSTYAPYALSGILNLADFSENQEIKSLAVAASKRLLKDMLMMTNNEGVFYPVAGRNYPGKYMSAHGQNHSSLIWLLTGLGPAPSKATHSGGFLASTTVDFSDVSDSWVSDLDTIYHNGHTLEDGFVINQNLTPLDRIIFQWSSGTYFHPSVVLETANLLADSNMWNHVDFELLQPLSGLPIATFPDLAEGLSGLSKSSVNVEANIAIFKKEQVTLCSNLDFWKGKVGYQQWPVCANSGTSAVYTASGKVEADWQDRNSSNANEHLPYVEQSHNVALVMYRPEPLSSILPFDNKDVALYWVDSIYDEVVENGNWLIGREEQGYVAVRRFCTDYIDGVRACETVGGQTWVIIVGNETMYGSFSNFQDLVLQSQYEETWTTNLNGDSTYYASIGFDTISIDYEWGPLMSTGVEEVTENGSFGMWPNPATETLTIELSDFNKAVNISVINNLGQVVYSKTNAGVQSLVTLPISNWSDGIYSVTVRDDEKVATQRLVKQ